MFIRISVVSINAILFYQKTGNSRMVLGKIQGGLNSKRDSLEKRNFLIVQALCLSSAASSAKKSPSVSV